MQLTQTKSLATTIVNAVFLIILNMMLMAIFNYLTIDSFATDNSRIGALVLSFFIPFFIVYKTQTLSGLERLLKYGFGFIADIILMLIIAGLPQGFLTGLIPCMLIALAVLYYGEHLLDRAE